MSELTQLIDKEIPDGRQSLQENFNNLERLAQYCQENYIKVIQWCSIWKWVGCPATTLKKEKQKKKKRVRIRSEFLLVIYPMAFIQQDVIW